MKVILKELDELLQKFEVRLGEDTYQYAIYEDDKELILEEEIDKLLNISEGIAWNMSRIGGFDSPGYTIDCYALAIYVNGEVEIYPINYEVY